MDTRSPIPPHPAPLGLDGARALYMVRKVLDHWITVAIDPETLPEAQQARFWELLESRTKYVRAGNPVYERQALVLCGELRQLRPMAKDLLLAIAGIVAEFPEVAPGRSDQLHAAIATLSQEQAEPPLCNV